VADALIHVDPENDPLNPPPVKFAARAVVSEAARQALCAQGLSLESLGLHYPSGGFGIDIVLPGELRESEVEAGGFRGTEAATMRAGNQDRAEHECGATA
jgi:hypothetical protein